jgi:hypothetical protein
VGQSGAQSGNDSDTSTATGGNQTDNTNVAFLTLTPGETVTLTELLGGSNAGSYSTSFACTGNTNDPGGSGVSHTLLVDRTDTAITCTYTNTLQSANLTLRKTWVNGVTGDTAQLILSGDSSGSNADTSTSTGFPGTETDDTHTAVLSVLVGETINLTEVLSDNTGSYNTGFSCTGNENTPGGSDRNRTLVIASGDAGGDIVCTFTNRVQAANLTLRKEWAGGVANDTAALSISSGFSGNAGATSTASGGNEVDNINTASISALVGDTVNLDELLGIGNTGNYSTSFNCTGNTNIPGGSNRSHTLLIDGEDDGDSIVCTYTNSQVAINLAKSVVSLTEFPNGIFTVVYEVTANNSGAGSGMYDIDDTFTPGNNVILQGGQATIVYHSGPGQSGTVTSPFANGGKPVDDATLAAGQTDVWRVTAVFTIDAASAEAGDLDCVDSDDFRTRTGTANGVTGSDTDFDLTDNRACAPLPQINLAKTVTGVKHNGGGSFTVTYEVTATNNGGGNGIYDIDDTFTPGANITLVSAELTSYNGGTENNQSGTLFAAPLPQDFPNGTKLVDNEGLTAGLSESWTVTADFDVDFSQASADDLNCVNYQDFDEHTGFSNGVLGSSTDIDLTTNRACAPLMQINLAKTVVSSVNTGGDSWRVVYRITASNNGEEDGTYNLVDTFSPGNGITLLEARLMSYDGGTENSQTGAIQIGTPLPQSFANGATLVTGEGLQSGLSESWTIEADFSIDYGQTDETLVCSSANNGENSGFHNFISGSASDVDLTDNHACDDPNVGKILFRVTKHFTDGNAMDVNVQLVCNTGLPLKQNFNINENDDVVFVITDVGTTPLFCDVFETEPSGYVPVYQASSITGVATISDDELGCHYDEVIGGEFLCEITNAPDPVDVLIEKLWMIEGSGGDVVDQGYKLTLFCDAQIAGGVDDCGQTSQPYQSCMVFQGDQSQTFLAKVIPDYPFSKCWVDEIVDSSYVEVENGCTDLTVSVAEGGDSCLIVNTVFFSDIPTLNQYGMLLMALLMLGMGWIGIRRFV